MLEKIPVNFQKIISQYETLFFIHIPKTAGKYIINEALMHEMGKKVYYIPHPVCTSKPLDLKGYNRAWTDTCINDEGFKKSLVFSIVRNPFDYLVSEYIYGFPYNRPDSLLKSLKTSIRLMKQKEEITWGDIREILHIFKKFGGHLLAKNRNTSFDPSGWPFHSFEEFIHAYCDPEYPWIIKYQHNFLFFQLFDDEGMCRCPFILRNECLNEGLSALCKAIGITALTSSNRINSSRGPGERDYKKYYSNELRELVEKKCQRELEAFGYSFEGHDSRIILDGSNIKYNPHTDEFDIIKYTIK